MLSLEMLRNAYAQGAFPMAEGSGDDAPIYWYRPEERAVFLPASFHVPRRLARLVRQQVFEIRWNDDFRSVMQECGVERPRSASWINQTMIEAYTEWHQAGEAFCLSVFREGERVGGIYGVQQGAIFTAESMFSRVPNASSVALVVLVAGLVRAGIRLIDVQLPNAHTEKFNITMMPAALYQQALGVLGQREVVLKADYFSFEGAISFTQSLSQTS